MRRLTLTKETVTELAAEELDDVVGGTVSDRVCNPNSYKVCLPTWDACFTTHGCG